MKVVIAEGTGAEENRRLVSMVRAVAGASVAAVVRTGADAIRTVLDQEPDVLILGRRLDPKEWLGVLNAVRPLLPELRVVALDNRLGGEFRRAFLLGDIDLLLPRADWADTIPGVLRQWQLEKLRGRRAALHVSAAPRRGR